MQDLQKDYMVNWANQDFLRAAQNAMGQNGGLSPIGTPQFPGYWLGMAQARELVTAVQSIIQKQKRIKGYQFNIIGGASQQQLTISGTARILLGLNLVLPTPTTVTITFEVNNEKIIVDLPASNFTSDFIDQEYYYIPRPLTGTDDVRISFNNTGAQQVGTLGVFYV